MGYSLWGHEESDMTEGLTLSLSVYINRKMGAGTKSLTKMIGGKYSRVEHIWL